MCNSTCGGSAAANGSTYDILMQVHWEIGQHILNETILDSSKPATSRIIFKYKGVCMYMRVYVVFVCVCFSRSNSIDVCRALCTLELFVPMLL